MFPLDLGNPHEQRIKFSIWHYKLPKAASVITSRIKVLYSRSRVNPSLTKNFVIKPTDIFILSQKKIIHLS